MNIDVIKLFAKNRIEILIPIQAVKIFTHDIGIEFGIEKCEVQNYAWEMERKI